MAQNPAEDKFQNWYADFKREKNESQRLSNARGNDLFRQPQTAAPPVAPETNAFHKTVHAASHLNTLRSIVRNQKLDRAAKLLATHQENERKQRQALVNAEDGWRDSIAQRFGVNKKGTIGDIKAMTDRKAHAERQSLEEVRRVLISKLTALIIQEKEHRVGITLGWANWCEQLELRFDRDVSDVYSGRRALVGWFRDREKAFRDLVDAESETRKSVARAYTRTLQTLKVGFDSETYRLGPEVKIRMCRLLESRVQALQSIFEGERLNRTALENSEEGFRRSITTNESSIRVVTYESSTATAAASQRWVASSVKAIFRGEAQDREGIEKARERWVLDWNVTHGSSLRRLADNYKAQIRLAVKALDDMKTTSQLETEERSARAILQRAWREWVNNEMEDRSMRLQAAHRNFLASLRSCWKTQEQEQLILEENESQGRLLVDRRFREWSQHIVVSEKYERVMLVPEREEYNKKQRGQNAPSAFFLHTAQLVKDEQKQRNNLVTVEEEWWSFFERSIQDGRNHIKGKKAVERDQDKILVNERDNRQTIIISEDRLRDHIEQSRTTCMKRIDENEANKQRMMAKSAAAKQQPKRAPSSSARQASKQPSMFSVNSVPLSQKMQKDRVDGRVSKNNVTAIRSSSAAPRKPLGELTSRSESATLRKK